MKNLSALKEENENLSRDLAESCRQYVELTFGYKDLSDRLCLQTKAFKNFIMLTDKNITEEEAKEKINFFMMKAQEPVQLDLPLKMENEF